MLRPPRCSYSCEIRPEPPYKLELVVWALKRRLENQIDTWDGSTYSRVLEISGVPIEAAVSQQGGHLAPQLNVLLASANGCEFDGASALSQVHRLLGLNANLSLVRAVAKSHPAYADILARFDGFRPPCFTSPFEAALNAISCQQLTLSFGMQLHSRLAERYGPRSDVSGASRFGIPNPATIAGADHEALRSLGFSRNKAIALVAAAESAISGDLADEALLGVSDDEAVSRLMTVRGIGRWSASYILLRGLGRLGAFPVDDVGAQNNLKRWLSLESRPNAAETEQIVSRFQPAQGMVFLLLLLDSLQRAGYFKC